MLWLMDEITRIRQAIRQLHGAESVHLGTHPVHERFDNQTVWEGDVHEFDLVGHCCARAYAWPYATDAGAERVVVVLAEGLVTGPLEAVRASIVAQDRRRRASN